MSVHTLRVAFPYIHLVFSVNWDNNDFWDSNDRLRKEKLCRRSWHHIPKCSSYYRAI